MSGAQPKAANIANAVGIFAEVDLSRIETRHDQGWVDVIMDDIDEIFKLANEKIAAKESISIARRRAILQGDIKSTSAPVRGERGTLWKSL